MKQETRLAQVRRFNHLIASKLEVHTFRYLSKSDFDLEKHCFIVEMEFEKVCSSVNRFFGVSDELPVIYIKFTAHSSVF